MNRRLVYGIIYIGVAVAFPGLPVHGLKVLLDLGSGMVSGAKEGVSIEIKDELVHAKDVILHPFGIIPKLFEKFNPFE